MSAPRPRRWTQLESEAAARSVFLDNGDWDGGLGNLADPAAAGTAVLAHPRRSLAAGGYIADSVLPAYAALIGADHVLTLAGAPHAPQRTHPEATIVALLQALGEAL